MTRGQVVLDEITREDCLALLSRSSLGRLGVMVGQQPLVLPVNYQYTADGIVVRTEHGTKLRAGDGRLVGFEVDEIDPVTHLGWSVVVQGHAFDVTETLDRRSERARETPVETWAPGARDRRLMIELATVTGRWLRIASSGGDGAGVSPAVATAPGWPFRPEAYL